MHSSGRILPVAEDFTGIASAMRALERERAERAGWWCRRCEAVRPLDVSPNDRCLVCASLLETAAGLA